MALSKNEVEIDCQSCHSCTVIAVVTEEGLEEMQVDKASDLTEDEVLELAQRDMAEYSECSSCGSDREFPDHND